MTSTERSNAPLGDVATKLLFEDGRVRIWELKLEPGEETPPHRHDLDYYIVMIDGDGIAARVPDRRLSAISRGRREAGRAPCGG